MEMLVCELTLNIVWEKYTGRATHFANFVFFLMLKIQSIEVCFLISTKSNKIGILFDCSNLRPWMLPLLLLLLLLLMLPPMLLFQMAMMFACYYAVAVVVVDTPLHFLYTCTWHEETLSIAGFDIFTRLFFSTQIRGAKNEIRCNWSVKLQCFFLPIVF